jgi:hypothetical protein
MWYGFRPDEWESAKAETLEILKAKASERGMITYGDLAKEITSSRFEPHEYALWSLIGEISEAEDDAGRGLLSALVVHKHGDLEPGRGFYELAAERGRDMSDKTKGWIAELHKVHEYWSNRPRA